MKKHWEVLLFVLSPHVSQFRSEWNCGDKKIMLILSERFYFSYIVCRVLTVRISLLVYNHPTGVEVKTCFCHFSDSLKHVDRARFITLLLSALSNKTNVYWLLRTIVYIILFGVKSLKDNNQYNFWHALRSFHTPNGNIWAVFMQQLKKVPLSVWQHMFIHFCQYKMLSVGSCWDTVHLTMIAGFSEGNDLCSIAPHLYNQPTQWAIVGLQK